MRFLNSILWNSDVQIVGESAENSIVEYTCIKSGWLGEGNINEDPKFVDSENRDYHLQNSSPCIDTGRSENAWNDADRPPGLGTVHCDMGAFGGPSYKELLPGVLFVYPGALSSGNGSSWENAMSSIKDAIALDWMKEIWVAEGRYNENIELKESMALYGGFLGAENTREERNWEANETIIDASGFNTTAVVGANNAVLDGFTVTGGEDSGINCQYNSPQSLIALLKKIIQMVLVGGLNAMNPALYFAIV